MRKVDAFPHQISLVNPNYFLGLSQNLNGSFSYNYNTRLHRI